MNPFLTIQSPDFGQFFNSSDPSTPNQSSILNCSLSRPFLEDEPDDPSFTVDEVEERLNNPVTFSVRKVPSDAPTPLELRMLMKEKSKQFFRNRTPSPSTQPSQPLLQDTPSTCERTGTPSMAEQFLMHIQDDKTPRSEAFASFTCSSIKQSRLKECTPVKVDEKLSSEIKKPPLSGRVAMKVSGSPVLLSSPIFKCSPILTNGSQLSKGSLPRQKLSRVRQRLEWNISPSINKHHMVRSNRKKQQILNRRIVKLTRKSLIIKKRKSSNAFPLRKFSNNSH